MLLRVTTIFRMVYCWRLPTRFRKGSALSAIGSDDGGRPAVVRSARDLGALVRARRSELGISQEDLSGITGLDRAFISLVERGERGMSIDSAVRLVQALGMDIEIRRRER